MKFRVIDLKAPHALNVWANGVVQVTACPEVELEEDEVGIVLPKHSFHVKGITCFSGIVNPGWKGSITIELVVKEELHLVAGQPIAHVLVFKADREKGSSLASPWVLYPTGNGLSYRLSAAGNDAS